jgi:predicted kinase
MKATLLIGPPSSGKSTAIAHNCFPGSLVVSLDTCRQVVNGDEGSQDNFALVKNLFDEKLKNYATIGANVVIDNTNCKRVYRVNLIKQLQELGYTEIVGVIFPRTPQECMELQKNRVRQVPSAVIEAMYSNLTLSPPSLDEGFDHLLTLRN